MSHCRTCLGELPVEELGDGGAASQSQQCCFLALGPWGRRTLEDVPLLRIVNETVEWWDGGSAIFLQSQGMTE